MIRKRSIYNSLLLISLLLIPSISQFFLPRIAEAGTFSQVYLRPDRVKASTSTTGLVCSQTPSSDNGTEANVQIVFPAGFSVGGASNWTVSTSNIPSGATAWPGIGTAISVSSQTVTFPSSSLSTNTLYCFRWTNTAALTTASAGLSSSGTVRTLTGGSSTVDTGNYSMSILSNDSLSVTATVPAQASDFQAELSSSTSTSPVPENTTVNYQISYGSLLTSTSSFTLEAQWDLGTVSGSSTPSVDLLDYVVGTASDGYGSTPAVVDTVNRKITWTFNSFPANTVNQTVQFQLKTNSNYTGTSTVTFPVAARILGPGTQTTDSIVTKTYKHTAISSGPTATPTPTSGTTPTSSTTPTPTVTPTPFSFTDISVQTLTTTKATLLVSTTNNASFTVAYGTSTNSLPNTLKTTGLQKEQSIALDGLTINTVYYFRITAVDEDGNRIQSDVYTFKTALTSELAQINPNSVVFTSNNVILHSGGESAIISVPQNLPYSFQFSIPNDGLVSRVQTVLKNKFVLGLKEGDVSDANTLSADATQIRPGVYVGHLKTPTEQGYYELYIRITDLNGNITETKLAEVKVSNRFTVRNNINKEPIEAARVLFYLYNKKTRLYEVFRPDFFDIKNPDYTNSRGELLTVLPNGQYKAEVSAIGHKERVVLFTIGPSSGESMPQVSLEQAGFSPFSTAQYYGSVATDVFLLTKTYINDLSDSYRFFNLVSVLTVFVFVALSIVSFAARLHIPILSIPSHLIHHLKFHYQKSASFHMLKGSVTDEKGKPVSQVSLYLLNPANNATITHTLSDSSGNFSFFKQQGDSLKVLLMKDGYKPSVMHESIATYDEKKGLTATLRESGKKTSLLNHFLVVQRQFFNISFEVFLFFSVLLELALGYSLGWKKVAVFIPISILNIILWGIHLHLSSKESSLT